MNRTILYTLICTAIFIAITYGLGQARNAGYLSDEFVRRAVQVLIGIGLAAWSNFTPKQIGPAASPQAEALKQRLLRVCGWSMTLAGLAYAGFWAFAPLGFARTASVVVVVTAMVLTLGYTVRTVAACRTLTAG